MNQTLFAHILALQGRTQQEVARKIRLEPTVFQKKLEQIGDAEFTLGEIQAMQRLLRLDTALVELLFFAD